MPSCLAYQAGKIINCDDLPWFVAPCEPAALGVFSSAMNLTAKFRLAALGVAAGLMGVLIALATIISQKTAGELRSQLNAVDSESFGISEHFKDSLREVNNLRL